MVSADILPLLQLKVYFPKQLRWEIIIHCRGVSFYDHHSELSLWKPWKQKRMLFSLWLPLKASFCDYRYEDLQLFNYSHSALSLRKAFCRLPQQKTNNVEEILRTVRTGSFFLVLCAYFLQLSAQKYCVLRYKLNIYFTPTLNLVPGDHSMTCFSVPSGSTQPIHLRKPLIFSWCNAAFRALECCCGPTG